jgi:hypothetical protein
MLQSLIYYKPFPFFVLNSESEFTLDSREDDVEQEDDEEEEETDNDEESKGDEHEGGERMPDLGEDIFTHEESVSIAECF